LLASLGATLPKCPGTSATHAPYSGAAAPPAAGAVAEPPHAPPKRQKTQREEDGVGGGGGRSRLSLAAPSVSSLRTTTKPHGKRPLLWSHEFPLRLCLFTSRTAKVLLIIVHRVGDLSNEFLICFGIGAVVVISVENQNMAVQQQHAIQPSVKANALSNFPH